MITVRSTAFVVLAAACSSSSPSTSNGPSCADRAAEIAAWAAELAPEGAATRIDGEHLSPGADLPLAVRADAPQVEITRAGLSVMGEHVAIADLAAKTARAHATSTPDAPWSRVIVAVDADVPIDDVAPVMEPLQRAGEIDVELASARCRRTHARRPSPSWAPG